MFAGMQTLKNALSVESGKVGVVKQWKDQPLFWLLMPQTS